MQHRIAYPLALALALAWPAAARAQAGSWELALQGGALRHDLFEKDGTDPVVGGRIARHFAGGWSVGGAVDWSASEFDAGIVGPDVPASGASDVDATLLRTSVAVDKAFAMGPRTRFGLGAGVGAARVSYDGIPGIGDESETSLLVPVSAGVRFLNRSEAPSWGLRLDVRDNLIFLDDEDPTGRSRDDDVVQQWEVSAGLSFFFGGRGKAAATRERDEPVAYAPPATDDSERRARERALAEIREKVFFDFDRYDLKPASRETLQRKSEALKVLSDVAILIEGHADERGTIEYNLALGERRANAARQYLIDLGIDPGRMTVVSYGEERPAVEGHNEAAWSQNRRDEFVPDEG